MDITDSITRQIISEDSSVTLMLLVNSRSEDNSVGLMTRIRDQYKLASLPIQATWTGYGFEAQDEGDLGVRMLGKVLGLDEDATLSDSLSSIWDYGHQSVEKPHWNCSNLREFSVFAVHPKTIEKLADTSVIVKNVPLLKGGDHLAHALAHAKAFIDKASISTEHFSAEERYQHQDEVEDLRRLFYLKSSRDIDREDGVPIPYAAYALNPSSESLFSFSLIKALHKESFRLASGELDEGAYGRFYFGVHLAAAICHALSHLDLALSPSHSAQSKFREAGKIEFMAKVLTEELRQHCGESSAYDDNPEKVIRDLLAPIKSCVADLTRLQHDLDSQGCKR